MVDTELIADVASLQDEKLLVELLLQLTLPLEGEVCRARHQHPLDEAAQLQLAHQEPGHDGLAGTGVVCEQEADGGYLQQMFVDGFELVRQRVHPRDGEAEVRVELVSDAERMGLQSEAQQAAVALVGERGIGDL